MYNNYYLIKHSDDKYLILAKSSHEAVTTWINHKEQKRINEGRMLPFDPRHFSVEEIGREDLVIKASE